MAFTIKYCEKCGERVDPGDFESGKAVTYKNESYCARCKSGILHLLEADPEYQQSLKQPARPSSLRLERPTTVRMQRANATATTRVPGSGISRRHGSSVGPVPAVPDGPAPAAEPAPVRRSSGRVPRRNPSRTGLILALAAMTVLVLGAVVAAVLFGSTSPVPPVAGTPPDTFLPPPDDGGISAKERERWETAYKAAQAFEANKAAEVNHKDPARRIDPIVAERAIYDEWTGVAASLAGTPFETLASERRKEAERRLEDRANQYFDRARRQVESDLLDHNFDRAREAWNRIPEPLRYKPEWQERIAREIARVDAAHAEWKAPEPIPDPRFQRTPSDRPVPDESWGRLQVPVDGSNPLFREEDGAYVLDNAGETEPLPIIMWQQFGLGELDFEVRLEPGASAWVEAPGHRLDLAGAVFATGRWTKVTLRYEESQVRVWAGDDVRTAQPRTAEAPDDLVLAVAPRSVLHVREIAIHAQGGGLSAGPAATGEVVLFDGSSASRFQKSENGRFEVEDGSLRCENRSAEQAYLLFGGADWGDGTLRLEVRGLEADETIVVGFNLDGDSIDPVELKGSYIPDPGTWTQVEVSAIGDSLRLKVGGQEVSRLARTPRRGPLALVFPAEVEAYVRNARIVLQ